MVSLQIKMIINLAVRKINKFFFHRRNFLVHYKVKILELEYSMKGKMNGLLHKMDTDVEQFCI